MENTDIGVYLRKQMRHYIFIKFTVSPPETKCKDPEKRGIRGMGRDQFPCVKG